MPVAIEVYRGAGDLPGAEIREPLIGDSLECALARGRAALDESAHTWERVELACGYRPELAVGQLVAIDDPVQGGPWVGRVIGLAHRYDDVGLTTTVTVRRPL